MSAQTGYQIKLTGPGLSLDKELSEELANRITLLVLSGGKSDQQPPGGKGGSGSGAASAPTIGGKSIREYLLASKATKIPQQMTVIGHYLLDAQQGKENFTLAELKKGFGDAKESVPANPTRDVASAIRRGWIAQREKDSYYVTGTGMQAIEVGFPEGTRRRRRKKASSAKTK